MKVSLFAAALLASTTLVSAQDLSLTAPLINTEGKEIGTATLTQTPAGVLIRIEAKSLPPGEHAMHVHKTGRCDPATQFESAGSHLAAEGQKHGLMVEGGPHAGDLPNQFVAADGALTAEVVTAGLNMAPGGNIRDSDGSAVVLHAKADDYTSQPSGEAGGRIACAAISP
jgi:Cu-Zn family superoxide dismutase